MNGITAPAPVRDRVSMTIGALSLILAAGAAALSLPSAASGLDILLYLAAGLIIFPEMLDFLMRVALLRRAAPPGLRIAEPWSSVALPPSAARAPRPRPYALCASVYQVEPTIDELVDVADHWRDLLWVIDDGSSDASALRLRSAGFRVVTSRINRKKPAAIRALLTQLPPEIETVLVLDPDCRLLCTRGELDTVIADFQRSGHAAMCPRIRVREDGLLARFQGLEYAWSCSLGRKALAGLSTNAGVSVYRRDALEALLERHSLLVYAEDLENSLLLLGAGETVYYDDRLVVETEAKRTWHGWFSQRVGWYFGLVRVLDQRWRSIGAVARRSVLAGYQYLIYLCVLTVLQLPMRLFAVVLLSASLANTVDGLLALGVIPDTRFTDPSIFLVIYFEYLALCTLALVLVVPRGERRVLLAAVPLYLFYSLAHQIPQAVGLLNWISLRAFGRRIYRDHYQDDASLRAALARNGR